MLSFLQSFFTTDKEPEIQSPVLNVLRQQGLKYKEVKGGVQVNIHDESENIYLITIPLKFIGYIQIIKELKDKSGDCFNCVYVYKFNKDELVFVNRIKLINSLNPDMIIDENDSRINIHLLGIVEKLVKNINNEIINGSKKDNSIDLIIDTDTSLSVTKSDVNDFNYIKYKSKYNNLKNTQDVTMLSTVSNAQSDSSASVQSVINTSDSE
jgi:hypothetical protein